MKGCHEEVMVVFLQAPNLVSAKTRFTDKSTKQLAIEFGMSDIKTTREGEHQENFLTRKNKFTEKQFRQILQSQEMRRLRLQPHQCLVLQKPHWMQIRFEMLRYFCHV